MNSINTGRKQRKFDDIKFLIKIVEVIVEVALLTVAYYYIWTEMYRPIISENTFAGNGKYVLMGVYAFLTLILFIYCEGFKFGYLKLVDVWISQCVSLLLVNFVTYLQLSLILNGLINPLPIMGLTAGGFILTFVLTYIYTRIYHKFYIPRTMVMIYGNDNAVSLKIKMDTRDDHYNIEKLISIDEGLEKICRTISEYDAVVINDVPAEIRNDILKFCYKNEIRAYLTPKISDVIVRGATDITLFDTPLLLVKGMGLTLSQRIVKRAVDIVLCLAAVVITMPIMIIIGIAIKLEDGGPVFFRQKRVTRNGREFNILKFRSMIVNAEKDGEFIPATGHDPRITKVGRVIRAIRLDELPQLFNILHGDMSIVGPRPERVEHVAKYTEEVPEFELRTKVKGGLTGYAQIYGKYNTSSYDKLRLDLMYIENYSMLLDIKLMLMTLRTMLKPESTEGFDRLEQVEEMRKAVLEDIENENLKK